MAAMGTEGKFSGQFFLTLGARLFLGIGSRVRLLTFFALFGMVQGLRFVVGFLEAPDGLANAVPQLRETLGAE